MCKTKNRKPSTPAEDLEAGAKIYHQVEKAVAILNKLKATLESRGIGNADSEDCP
jgi:hypothetical protein